MRMMVMARIMRMMRMMIYPYKEKDDGEDTIVIEKAHDAEAMSWKF